MYYWNLGLAAGKVVLIGPFDTEAEAAESGFLAFDGGNFTTHELPTKDRGRATQMIKYKRIESGMSAGEAMENISHKV